MPRPWLKRSPFGEMEMVSEYVQRAYPTAEIRFRVRLGTSATALSDELTEAEVRAVGTVQLRWADVVVITPRELVVVEGKMRSGPGAISQLELYGSLVPLTQELVPFMDRQLVLELVVSIEDPLVTRMATERGIRVAVYRPSWFAAWAARRDRRESRPHADGGLR